MAADLSTGTRAEVLALYKSVVKLEIALAPRLHRAASPKHR